MVKLNSCNSQQFSFRSNYHEKWTCLINLLKFHFILQSAILSIFVFFRGQVHSKFIFLIIIIWDCATRIYINVSWCFGTWDQLIATIGFLKNVLWRNWANDKDILFNFDIIISESNNIYFMSITIKHFLTHFFVWEDNKWITVFKLCDWCEPA